MTDKQKVLRQVMELRGLQDRANRLTSPFAKAQVGQQAIPLAIDIIDALAKEVFKEEFQEEFEIHG